MEKYRFFKRENGDIIAVHGDRIEKLKLSDTYDRYGFSISPARAGDSIYLFTEKAVILANELWSEEDLIASNKWKIGDTLTAYHFGTLFESLIENLTEDIDYFYAGVEIEALNWFDGSNWKTLTFNYPEGDDPLEEITNETFKRDIEKMQYVSTVDGIAMYEGDDYYFLHSSRQTVPEDYTLRKIRA